MTQHGTITTDDGVAFAWRSDGDHELPPLLLANSLGTTMAMWEPQVPIWAKTHRVIRYDMCGHGASADRPAGFGIERLGRDALALLDDLGITTISFVGLSLGGMVGQWLGIAVPDRLAQLVLANTSAHMPPREAWDNRIAAVRNDGLAAIAPAVVERWFTPEFRSHSPVPDQIAAVMMAGSAAGYAASCAAIRDMDFRDQLSRITASTLVIGGTADPATPPPHSQTLADVIAGSELVWLDAAHLSNLECPEEFTAAVAQFLTRPVTLNSEAEASMPVLDNM